MRHTWALGSGSSKGEVIFKHTSVLLIIAFVLSLGLLPQGLDAQTISKQLGGFKIVDLAGIPHLQDKNRYYIFPAFCPTACNAPWARSAGTMGNIGAIVVNFGQPGDYAFFYYIKPLIGEFVNLTTLQVIVLPKGEGTSPLQDVNWYMYPYTIEGVSRFRISKPGVYIIAFGPGIGTALTKLEAQRIPSGFTLKYKIDPPGDWSIIKSDADLQFRQSDGKFLYRLIGYEQVSESETLSKLQIFTAEGLHQLRIPKDNAKWLLGRALDNTLIGGSNLRYPLGKNADYAAMRIREFIPLIKVMISENDNETAQITTAKILSNILTYREDAQKKNVPFPEGKFIKAENSWLNSDYVNSLEICAEIAKDILPTTYPEQQTIPADYTQIRKTLDSVTDPIVEHGGNFIDLFPQ